ncbi:hypothetical protein [Streptomyces sp. cmx-4-9]|uniref:hypothetical protein n=1 Tax=Streptomyces sp. cmx-4-9 TaxID=2790941 RepID=UPI003980C2E7
MISEPELEGQWEPAAPPEVAQGAPPRERGPVRPWWWVSAAVLATSAVWAGGLFLYGERLTAPEVRYETPDNLCEKVKLSALGEALRDLSDDADPHRENRHPALDWATCSRSGSTPAGDDAYFVTAEVELHKKTDPAAEFEAGSPYDRAYSQGGGPRKDDPWEAVAGLGEQALITAPDPSGAGSDLRLRVRDGGAVFTLQVVFLTEVAGEDRSRPDREALKAAMVKDMRTLMAALHT